MRADLDVPRGLQLVVCRTGQVVELSAERPVVRVGRVEDNDLVIPAMIVSKRQMQFTLIDGVACAEDLESACGTFVDGRRIIAPTKLGRGAVVSFANFDIELVER